MNIKDFKMDIPTNCKIIIDKLNNHGFEGFVVGGCVRDTILEREIHDWDICTDCKPEKIMSIFRLFNIIPTGIKHGTVTVVIKNIPYEITTYRADDQYSNKIDLDSLGFTSSLYKDLSRRDFTINAMAYSPLRGLIDPFNGYEDIKRGIIRTVGNEFDRLNEDPLRLLRAYRFKAKLNFDIESSLKKAIQIVAPALEKIASERIVSEFNQIILLSPFMIKELYNDGVLQKIFPVFNNKDFDQNNPYHNYSLYDHIFTSVNVSPAKLHVRLAMLLHDIGKMYVPISVKNNSYHYYNHAQLSKEYAEKLLRDLKYDNYTINKILMLIENHDREIINKTSLKKVINKLGIDLTKDLLDVKHADILAQSNLYYHVRYRHLNQLQSYLDEIINKEECFSIKDLKISGRDIIALGIDEGIKVGNILRNILDIVIKEQVPNEHDKLIELAKVLISTDDNNFDIINNLMGV